MTCGSKYYMTPTGGINNVSKTPEESKLGHRNQMPETKLAGAFKSVLINSKFDDNSINKRTMTVLYRSPEQTALHTYC